PRQHSPESPRGALVCHGNTTLQRPPPSLASESMAHTPVLVEMHPACEAHFAGRGHPERPDRLNAVRRGLKDSCRSGAATLVVPRAATRAELTRVHLPEIVDALERFCRSGGGQIDADTAAGPESWDAALAAAGAGLDAVERLRAGEAEAAFVAGRP